MVARGLLLTATVGLVMFAGCVDRAAPQDDGTAGEPQVPEGSITSAGWSYSPAGVTVGCPTSCISLNANSMETIRAPKGGRIVGFEFTLTEETAAEPGKPFHVKVSCMLGTRTCPAGTLAQADGPAPLTVSASNLVLTGNETLSVEVVWDRITPPVLNAVTSTTGQAADTYTIAGSVQSWVPKKTATREL